MLVRLLCFLMLSAIPRSWAQAPDAAMNFGRYHALVIGNADYRDFPKLPIAVADARAVALTLRDYGFQTDLVLNASQERLLQILARYEVRAASDNLLIYHAGRSVREEASGQCFWLPVDAGKDGRARWIDTSIVSDRLKAFGAHHILLIADSCYADILPRDAEEAAPARDGVGWLTRARARRARQALVSGALEPEAGTGDGPSIFAQGLIGALRENRAVLSGRDLFIQTRASMAQRSRQTPAFQEIRMVGHRGGEFLFVSPARRSETRASASGVAVPASPPPVLRVITAGLLASLQFAAGVPTLPPDVQERLGEIAAQLSDTNERITLRSFATGIDESASRRMALSRAIEVRRFLGDKGVAVARINFSFLGRATDNDPGDHVDIELLGP